MMKVLLITTEPPLDSSEIVSGNAVRADQLSRALTAAGHRVSQTWLSSDHIRPAGSFRNRDELQGVLTARSPDALLVGYWELLAMLPIEPAPYVILDYVAPRSLEELFEAPQKVVESLRRFRLNLRRCDAVLVGNARQRPLLINNLIEAGVDLRAFDPLLEVPLGAEPAAPPVSSPANGALQLIAGGVDWPWRVSGSFARELHRIVSEGVDTFRLTQFGGAYKWHQEGSAEVRGDNPDDAPNVEIRPLAAYHDFSRYLTDHGHVGIELAQHNLERHYSQSFRSLEFLRHGLPVICNDYLPLAPLIREHEAGWVVCEPGELEDLLNRIANDDGEWRRRSENARSLVSTVLRPERAAAALVEWLQSPRKAPRLPVEEDKTLVSDARLPVLGVPPLGQRIRRQFDLARQVLMGRLFGQQGGTGVVFVTRGDLFPVDHGAAVRTVETARALSRAGLEVGIVSENRGQWHRFENGQEKAVRYPWWVRFMSLPGPLVKLLHFSKDLPYSNSFLYLPLTDGGFRWRAIAVARALNAGILQAEFPAYALPCVRVRETLGCKVVLVQHNVEYDRIRNQVEELDEAQYENLKEIEISLCNESDAVVCVSDNDRQKLGEDGVDPDKMHTILHGVDLAQYDLAAEPGVRDRFGIAEDDLILIYHGTFSYPPNLEALHVFAEQLLPRLDRLGLNCHVLAVGRKPPPVSPHPRIHLTGSVTRVAPWLKAADLAVVPLIEGGGTRMKIIDCFAARLPVISTSKGIEGIPAVPGRHALVLDDWDEMAEAIVRLGRDPDDADRLAGEGRLLAESLDWSAIAGEYRALYARL